MEEWQGGSHTPPAKWQVIDSYSIWKYILWSYETKIAWKYLPYGESWGQKHHAVSVLLTSRD